MEIVIGIIGDATRWLIGRNAADELLCEFGGVRGRIIAFSSSPPKQVRLFGIRIFGIDTLHYLRISKNQIPCSLVQTEALLFLEEVMFFFLDLFSHAKQSELPK